MGTIAARHARTAVRLSSEVAAIHLLALAQAADLRGPALLAPATGCAHAFLRTVASHADRDRPLDSAIQETAALIRAGTLREAVAFRAGLAAEEESAG